jgi:hypothetical protein
LKSEAQQLGIVARFRLGRLLTGGLGSCCLSLNLFLYRALDFGFEVVGEGFAGPAVVPKFLPVATTGYFGGGVGVVGLVVEQELAGKYWEAARF